MIDTVDILEQRPELGAIGDVTAGEEHVIVESTWISSAQVIDDPNLMTITT
jgi:hypothetical protein